MHNLETEIELEFLIRQLEECGGNVDKLIAQRFEALDNVAVIFAIERRLADHKDIKLKERWEKAIELGFIARMRLLKNKALDQLEKLDFDNKNTASVQLAFAKVMLGDDLVGASTVAKRRAFQQTADRTSALDQVAKTMDEEDD